MSRPDPDLLEARVAARLAALLTQAAAELPGGVDARLRAAREQALDAARARARQAATAAARPDRARPRHGFAWLAGAGGERWRAALGAAVPAAVLLAGAWLLAGQALREHADVAATVDVALLADELPPEAYADPGFVAFLELRQP